MTNTLELVFKLQIIVSDALASPLDFNCTERHLQQGFCRAATGAAFYTPIEFGRAEVRFVKDQLVDLARYDRVVAVIVSVPSGEMVVYSIDYAPSDYLRFPLAFGLYRVIAAQKRLSEYELKIDFFVVPVENIQPSEILLRDPDLCPIFPLLDE